MCGLEADHCGLCTRRTPDLYAARIVGSCWLKMLRLELAAAAAADAMVLALRWTSN